MSSRHISRSKGFARPWIAASTAVAVTTVVVIQQQRKDEPAPKPPVIEQPVVVAGISGTGDVEQAYIQYPFGRVPFSDELVITHLEVTKDNKRAELQFAGISGTGDRIFVYLDNKPLIDALPDANGNFKLSTPAPKAGIRELKFYRVGKNNKPQYSSAPVTIEIKPVEVEPKQSSAPVTKPAPAPVVAKVPPATKEKVAPKKISTAVREPRPATVASVVPSSTKENDVLLYGFGEARKQLDIIVNDQLLETVVIPNTGRWKTSINTGKPGKHYLVLHYRDNKRSSKVDSSHGTLLHIKPLIKRSFP